MKYKIGDTVKILRVYRVTDPNLNSWIGKVSKIKEVNPEDWAGEYRLENGFPAYEGELELVLKFKVGDRVRINCPNNADGSLCHGEIGVVEAIATYSTDMPYIVRVGGDTCHYAPCELEEIEIGDKFRVGDRVRVTSTAIPECSRGVMGLIYQIDVLTGYYPFKVKLDNGHKLGYNDNEIEKVDVVLADGEEMSGFSLKVPVFNTDILNEAMDMLGRPEIYYSQSARWIGSWFNSLDLHPKQEAKPKATTTFSLLGKDGLYYDAEFVHIGFEMFRSYLFPAERSNDDSGSTWGRSAHIVRIDTPKWLYVAPSGSHRIIDKQGRSHYIPCGWKHLWWKVEDGK